MSLGSAKLSPAGRVRTSRALVLCTVVLVASGCAETQIRRSSDEAMQRGDFAAAIQQLQAGLGEHPDSTMLRSGLLRARAEAIARSLTSAAALRAQGQYAAARSELERSLALDPGNARIEALLGDLDLLVRQQVLLDEAQRLADQREPEAALARARAGLRLGARHPGLMALQRRLELDLRQAAGPDSELRLADVRPVSLDFRDASLRSVLDVVSRHSGVNFILDRDIQAGERITVFLRNARVEDALDLIVSTGQLAKKVVDHHTVVVYPNTPDKRRQYEEQLVRVFYLSSAEASGAASFLTAMLKINAPYVDERANMVSLRDTPENIRLAERLLSLYDAGEPEVLLDVEVLEVSSTRLTELGVKFPDTFSLTPLAPGGASGGLTLGNIDDINRDRIALGVSGLLVNLRREVGDFTTLANPRIRVRNKQKANILIGDKIPVITTTTGTGGFVSDSVNYLDVGLKLDVEPTVYADDEVAIKMALEVSSLGSSVKTSSGTLAYQIGTRSASTLLRLRDGETQLLAGLISRDERASASRVPGIGDLPVLGRLFSSQLDTGSRTELVLAVTPRIVRGARQLSAAETELSVGTDANPRLKLPRAAVVAPIGATAGGPDVRRAAPPPAAAPGSQSVPQVPADPGMQNRGPSETLTLQWQAPAQLAVGQPFEVVVAADASGPLRGLPLFVRFDPALLQVVEVRAGSLWGDQKDAVSITHAVDATAGRVRVSLLSQGSSGARRQGSLAIVKFRATRAGSSKLHLEAGTPRWAEDGARGLVQLPAALDLELR